MTEDQQRFEEIIQEIRALATEARDLLPNSVLARANSYWYSHITTALNDDNEFMGRSMCNMQDSLEDWQELTDENYTSSDSYNSFMSQEEYDDYAASNPLPNDEDWDSEYGRPAHMRDEDRD